MIIIYLLQTVSPAAPPSDAWASISVRVPIAQISTTIDFVKEAAGTTSSEYTLRLIERRADGSTETLFADGRTCSGVRDAVEGLRSLPFPVVSLPRDDPELVIDGVSYSVRFSARYGSQFSGPLELRSNIGTPLAAWVDGTVARVKPCWAGYRALR